MDSDNLFKLANTLNAIKYSMGHKYGPDVLYNLHEANLYVMKAALEIENSKKKTQTSL